MVRKPEKIGKIAGWIQIITLVTLVLQGLFLEFVFLLARLQMHATTSKTSELSTPFNP